MSHERASWGSRLGFVLASAGSAVGLGAIWKFPYVAGQNGGGAFLLVYFACVATLGLSLLLAEMLIGRLTRRSATTAFRDLGGPLWAWPGRLSVLCLYCILSFYCVVGGWTLAYVFAVLDPAFLRQDSTALAAHFSALTGSPVANSGHALLFLGITAAVVLAGVEKGIERMSKLLMPALFLLMLLLIARVLSLPGAMDGLRYFLAPDFSRASADMVVQALGLAFFSLSLGCGVIVAYGSYVRPPAEGGSHLAPATLWVAALATLACLLAGLMVLPAVFAFGLDPAAGPGLTFITMPSIFAQMPWSQGVALAFFLLLFFAALTSAVSILEPVVSFGMDELHWTRRRSTVVAVAAVAALAVPVALSFGPWAQWTLAGRTLFGVLDYLASNLLMPAGGVAVAVLAGSVAWPRLGAALKDEMPAGGLRLLRLLWWLAPALIALLWWQGL